MSNHGHPAIAALCGLMFGVFLAVDLLLLGTMRLDNALVVIMPLISLIVGVSLGWLAPLKMLRRGNGS